MLGHAVTAPPVRDGPDGIANSGRDRPKAVRALAEFACRKLTFLRYIR
jgi:hypothetical protein